jgi:hypothetical protein
MEVLLAGDTKSVRYQTNLPQNFWWFQDLSWNRVYQER